MPRIIAQNRIPRVRIGNRYIGFRSGDGGGGYQVGDVVYSLTPVSVAGQTWEDVSIAPSAPYLTADFPALAAKLNFPAGVVYSIAGSATGATFQSRLCYVYQGALWGVSSGAQLRRKLTIDGPYGANLFASSPNAIYDFSTDLSLGQGATRLFASGGGGAIGYVMTITDETTATGWVNVNGDGSSPYQVWAALEVGPANTFILTHRIAGPILRTTNNGVSWTPITSALGSRIWGCIWRSGSNIFMLSMAGDLATSVDDGLTWGVTTGLPGAAAIGTASYSDNVQKAAVMFDFASRTGYVVTSGSPRLLSFNMDAPATGFTAVTAVNTFAPGAQFYCDANYMYSLTSYNLTTKIGLWRAKFTDPSNWTQSVAPAGLPIQGNPGASVTNNTGGYLALSMAGVSVYVNSINAGAALTALWAMANGVTSFDRPTLPDIGALNPWMRVK